MNYNFSERHIRRLGAKKPFNVLIFGGESAQFLPHLTKLSVWIVDVDKIFGIEFTFKAEVEGSKKHILGRRDAYLDQSRTYSIADGPSDVVEEFDINGPGGERIVQVETQQDEHGYFKDLRVHAVTYPKAKECSANQRS